MTDYEYKTALSRLYALWPTDSEALASPEHEEFELLLREVDVYERKLWTAYRESEVER